MIESIEEYDKLATMADEAEGSLMSLRFGNHWLLRIYPKQKHGFDIPGREEAIKKARQLCDEFWTAYNADTETPV